MLVRVGPGAAEPRAAWEPNGGLCWQTHQLLAAHLLCGQPGATGRHDAQRAPRHLCSCICTQSVLAGWHSTVHRGG
jgi:hypothetical protein